jgi:hypothetical protein
MAMRIPYVVASIPVASPGEPDRPKKGGEPERETGHALRSGSRDARLTGPRQGRRSAKIAAFGAIGAIGLWVEQLLRRICINWKNLGEIAKV